MLSVSFGDWSRLIVRRIMLSTRKFQFFVFTCVVFLILMLFAKLSSIQNLQENCLESIAELNSKQMSQADVKSSLPRGFAKKPKYWLAAKNPDGVHLEHVRNVFNYLGYERSDGSTEPWDVMWSYEYPFSTYITQTSIKPHQLINHFPGSGYLTSKVFLATSQVKYIPIAFSLPQEKNKFIEYAKTHKETLWVQKSNSHRGITIKSVDELDLSASHSFVQEYVKDPFLVDGRKFDIGIYTIITSFEPLRVYAFNGEWLVRYCTESYYPFDVHNPGKYVVGDDYTPTWELPSLKDMYERLQFSHKESLAYFINKKGLNFNKLQQEVYTAIGDVILEKKVDIMKSFEKYPYGSTTFFEMVRFDFVFDSKLNVYLMEVNMSPNLSSAHFKPNSVLYEQVIFNTLSLVGLSRAFPLKSNIDDTLVINRNIQVFAKECISCASCSTDICKLCLPCLDDSLKVAFKSAFREQVNRVQSIRVFPKVSSLQPKSNDYDALLEHDKLMHLWYKGMCLKDQQWCN